MPSKLAKQVNDAYFTPPETVQWCYEVLADLYTLEGKTALEPSCGSGVFVKGAAERGLAWTTNELFPAFGQGFEADVNVDFVKNYQQLGNFDFVIGNPPFGHASGLARKFVVNGLSIGKVVAMVLPKGCRRWRFIDSLPADVCVKFDQDLPFSYFDLPDGEQKKVGCTFMVFEHVEGYVRPELLKLDELPFKWEVGGFHPEEWATHGIGLLHQANRKFVVEPVDGGLFKAAQETFWMKLNKKQAKQFEKLNLDDVLAVTQTSIGRLTWREVVTRWNEIL